MKRVYSDYLKDIITEIDLIFDFCKEIKNPSEFLNDKKLSGQQSEVSR